MVLAALPTVMIALWADYFARYLEDAAKEDPEFDRAVEYQTIRMAGMLGLFLQALLFLCAGELRELTPNYLHFLPIAGVAIQTWLQARLESKLKDLKAGKESEFAQSLKRAESASSPKNPQSDPFAATGEMWRAFVWSLVAGALYAGMMIGSLLIAALAVRATGMGPLAATAAMFGATVFGVLGGLGANFALSPFFMRKMMNADESRSEPHQTLVDSVFSDSGFTPPRLYVVAPGKPFAGAVLAGLGSGKGIFAPALFITEQLSQSMTPELLRAVVAHELSHLKLSHLRKRLFFAGTLVISVATAASLLVVLSNWMLKGEANQLIGLAAGVAAFFVAFHQLRAQNRRHEIEADAYCVSQAGIPASHLIAALKKLHGVNERLGGASATESLLAGLGHPELNDRIQLIQKAVPVAPAAADSDQSSDRAA